MQKSVSHHIRSKDEVIRILSVSPTVQAISEIAARRNLAVFLCGGALRDLFLGRSPGNDWDFLVQGGTPESVAKLAMEYKEITASGSFPGSSPLEALDLLATSDALSHVRQFDLSIHTLLYDCLNPQIFDMENGIEDLRNGRLRIPHRSFLVTNASSFLRPFLFAQELGFQIEPEALEAVREFRHMVHATDSRGRAKVFSVFMQYLAQESIFPSFELMNGTGLVAACFPMLIPLQHSRSNSKAGSAWEENLAALKSLENLLQRLPQAIRAAFSDVVCDRRVVQKLKMESRFSLLSDVRFAALVFNLHFADLIISDNLPDFARTPEYRAHAMKAALHVFSQTVSMNTCMLERITEVARTLALAEHCLAEYEAGRFAGFAQRFSAAEPLHRKAVLLAAARLESERSTGADVLLDYLQSPQSV